MKKVLVLLAVVLSASTVFAQEDGIYTSSMFTQTQSSVEYDYNFETKRYEADFSTEEVISDETVESSISMDFDIGCSSRFDFKTGGKSFEFVVEDLEGNFFVGDRAMKYYGYSTTVGLEEAHIQLFVTDRDNGKLRFTLQLIQIRRENGQPAFADITKVGFTASR